MSDSQALPLARERNVIAALLLGLAAAGWAIIIWQAQTMDREMSLTMGMGTWLFLATWAVMMVAMMFPTAAPMVLTFARIQGARRQQSQAFVPVWLFVAAYLILWTAFGAIAFLVASAADTLADDSMWLMDNAARIGGGVIVLAGLYQLSPLKWVCLSKCRSPMSFIHTSWRDGPVGAVRMGLEHGTFCIGCCWMLFVILFPLGIMNAAAMAVITLLIFAEKSLPQGREVTRFAAALLIAYGALVIAVPGALPTMM